jgi:FtsP/CotA-like multicopper oxidase with cupredoxin domain
MYHPHADEMTQMAMGMMGFWVTHPKTKHPLIDEVRPGFLLPAQRLRHRSGQLHTQGHDRCWTSTCGPGTAGSFRASTAQRAQERQGAHPHRQPDDDQPPDSPAWPRVLVTGTDGGPTPKSTRWYEVTTDVAVGQMRQIEFIADEEGDWAFHCHKSHHTMNAMGHDVPTMIGVDHRGSPGRSASSSPTTW